jgi:hypothetical protein
LLANEVKEIVAPANVTKNGFELTALKPVPVFKTVIKRFVAPAGTVTVKLFADAALTVALVAPKKTILLVVVVLNPVPEILTVVPIIPLVGLKLLKVGCAIAYKTLNNRLNVKKACLTKYLNFRDIAIEGIVESVID